jgi:dodecin
MCAMNMARGDGGDQTSKPCRAAIEARQRLKQRHLPALTRVITVGSAAHVARAVTAEAASASPAGRCSTVAGRRADGPWRRLAWPPGFGRMGRRSTTNGRGAAMSVARVTEIISASDKSFDHAVKEGIERANQTLENIKEAWVASQKVVVENGRIVEYRVTLKVTFILR